MPDALKNIAVDMAGAAGAASAAINNLHGVLRLLARDHRRIQTLLGYALHGETGAQEGFWRQARRELIAHERAEVDVVIDLLHPSGKYEGLVERHRHDVTVLERRVQEIDEAEVGSEAWTRALGELRDMVRDHTFEEEAELFHWIESDLGRSGVEAAVNRVEAAKEQVFASGEQSTILRAASDRRERPTSAQLPPEVTPPVGPTEPDLPPIEPPEPDPPPAVPPGPQEPPMEPPGPTKPPVRPPGPTPPPAKVEH